MRVSVSEFKAKCLRLMDEVSRSGQMLVVTKHGKPIVTVAAARPAPKPLFGADAGLIETSGDLVTPVSANWDAAR